MLKIIFTETGISLLVVLLTMFAVWLVQLRTHNAGVVDGIWAANFFFIALVVYFYPAGWEPRKLLLLFLTGIWSLRLAFYLLNRIFSHIEEERRYAALRKEWGANANSKMLKFFLFQGLINVLLALPFFLSSTQSIQQIQPTEIIGACLVLGGMLGEAIADAQLKAFKKQNTDKHLTCTKGLWNYSRHPNYFFEWVVWIGFFVFALQADWGWVGILSPILMYHFLLNVTGIPMTEELAVKTKGQAYIDYQKSTSKFIPWKKIKE